MDSPVPYNLTHGRDWMLPIVVSAPHAGVEVPPGFSMPTGPRKNAIEAMSDTNVNRVAISAGQTLGFPVLSSRYLRAFIDLNRELGELDPELIEGVDPRQAKIHPGSRLAAGLGLIPRLADPKTPIYAKKLDMQEVRSRIAQVYIPYHDTLQSLIDECLDRFGVCFLIDLHSMPPLTPAVARRSLALSPDQPSKRLRLFPDSPTNFVMGDRFGATLSKSQSRAARIFWQERGYTVSQNHPYSGGFITETYGQHIPALQVEICRRLVPGTYLTDASLAIEESFGEFAETMAQTLFRGSSREAAE
ncbi:MAG: N-formylglutamate amidohydrolase [Alphaproteobacteria bacterium]